MEILPSLPQGPAKVSILRGAMVSQFCTPLPISPTSQVSMTAAQRPVSSTAAARMTWGHVGLCYPITKEKCRLPALDMDV